MHLPDDCNDLDWSEPKHETRTTPTQEHSRNYQELGARTDTGSARPRDIGAVSDRPGYLFRRKRKKNNRADKRSRTFRQRVRKVKPTEEQLYSNYVAFCMAGLIAPQTFERWQQINIASWASQDRNVTDPRANRK
jgi:hypothetical protein